MLVVFWLQDNAIFFHLESLKVQLIFHDLSCFEIKAVCLFFSIQNIKSNCYIIFPIVFPMIFFWWENYSFLVIFIYKNFNFCYSLRIFFYFFLIYDCYRVLKAFVIIFFDRVYCYIFAFYPIRRIHIWSTTIGVYFMEFIIQ